MGRGRWRSRSRSTRRRKQRTRRRMKIKNKVWAHAVESSRSRSVSISVSVSYIDHQNIDISPDHTSPEPIAAALYVYSTFNTHFLSESLTVPSASIDDENCI